MTRSQAAPTPDLCQEISAFLCDTLTAIHSKRAALLTPKGQRWLQARSATANRAQMAALLAKQENVSTLWKTIQTLLHHFCITDFQGSKLYTQILQRVQALIDQPEVEKVAISPLEIPSSDRDLTLAADQSYVGLVLLDAENMTLPAALETVLQNIGQYPIRYRLAFANWQKLGDRDQILYQRGYQLVHVPSGKNSADIKMSIDGVLISLRNPLIREVFVCSTDSDLMHLSHSLIGQGITPYRVCRHENRVEIRNVLTQKTGYFVLPQPEAASPKAPNQPQSPAEVEHLPSSASQLREWLKILILQAQHDQPNQPIKIADLARRFCDRNHVAVNTAIRSVTTAKNLTQFLKTSPQFQLSQISNSQSLQVTLRKPSENAAANPVSSAAKPAIAKISDAATLEQAVVKLMWTLSANQAGKSIHLSVLGSEFSKTYQEPMSKVLKRIGEPKGLPKFLAKCHSLRIKKQGKAWQVLLACVS